ncbi:hypothetical protein [Pyrobaculum aerophilum]|uniref:hypothetical protein n=1 Tax=Pyrobaculum aerophilum TaxID=13773 RepID=UPI0023F1DC14|nr:hypothetical protein [Pyrobaculum aerophilum]MCX8136783.1 hypothetical protein [Pyrobaculum aerophilum]
MKKGVIALLILIAGALAYFVITAGNQAQPPPPPPTPSPAETKPPAVLNTSTAMPTAAETPAIKSYEINYSHVITVYIGDIALKMSGWTVEGVGEYGNYSFGKLVLNIPPQGPVEITYKAATEGRTVYVVTCASGQCQAGAGPANYTSFLNLKGDSRAEKGSCSHLGLAGRLYEERGRISPETLSQILSDLSVNGTGVFTAVVCEAGGVPLTTSANVYLNVTLYGQVLTIKLIVDSSAVSISAYNSTRYKLLLTEAKAAQRASA